MLVVIIDWVYVPMRSIILAEIIDIAVTGRGWKGFMRAGFTSESLESL